MRKIVFLFLCVFSATSLLQASVSKTINSTAGGLYAALTSSELSTVTNLTITGIIDARDFKTMRDNMTALSVVDISAVAIADYTGTEGTFGTTSRNYPANTLPDGGFSGNNRIKSITLPSSGTAIGGWVFEGCVLLSSVIFPDPSLFTSIGESAFHNCRAFLSFTIPSSVTSLGTGVFSGCTGLKSVTIPSSITTIPNTAFYNCSSLTSLSIPASVTSIQFAAFYNCNSVYSIYSYRSSPLALSASNSVFYLISNNCVLYVPKGSAAAYEAAEVWTDFTNIVEFTPTGVEQVQTKTAAVYPNPAKDIINIANSEGVSSIIISNTLGQTVWQGSISNFPLSVSKWTNGIYFISMVINGKEYIKQFIKE